MTRRSKAPRYCKSCGLTLPVASAAKLRGLVMEFLDACEQADFTENDYQLRAALARARGGLGVVVLTSAGLCCSAKCRERGYVRLRTEAIKRRISEVL
jgi:hypothetical protein